MTAIDAHHHVWDLARADYPWLGPDAGSLFRDHELAETAPARHDLGVTGVVLVQSADNDDDTATMLREAARHPEVRGVVGWAPWNDADGVAERVAVWRSSSSPIVGTRNLIHDRADTRWVLRDDVNDGLGVLAEAGLPVDIVTADPAALAHVEHIAARQPTLGIVVDHLGKPPIGAEPGRMADWRAQMRDVAAIPTVSMKVSGLYPAQGDMAAWTLDDLRPVVETALAAFGPRRLMLGGDWPIANLAGGYRRVWGALAEIVGELAEADRLAITAGTATSFYGLAAGDAPST